MDNKERIDNDNDFKRMVKSIKIFINNENNISFRVIVNNLIEFATKIKQDRDTLLLKLKEIQQREYGNFCKMYGEEFFNIKDIKNSGNVEDMDDDELLSYYFWSGNLEKEYYEKVKKEAEKRGIVPKGMD